MTPTVEISGSAAVRVTVTAPDGKRYLLPANCETEMEDPQLWWPNGLGEQPLYTFRAEISGFLPADI